MKTNPGGQIDSRAVIGRDKLIQLLWGAVAEQSLVITAERRIGKTTVMKKMASEPAAGWLAVYQDLESCHSAIEFAMAVSKQVYGFLGAKKKLGKRTKELFGTLGGAEISGFFSLPEKSTVSWKDVLTRAVEDLISENDQGTKLLFLWDEVPFMLMNIQKGEGGQTAMQVLDHLRWLRQTHSELRMVITGSIGLHHVIASMDAESYGNAPVNDMYAKDVPPLSPEDAARLARELIAGEELESPDLGAAAEAIAEQADCFPFYVHHIVRALKAGELVATPESVAKIVASHLVDSNDPWQLLHYRVRISTYYPGDQGTVHLILDHLAVEQGPASVSELLVMLKGSSEFGDRERLLNLLILMDRDHYLKRADDGQFYFRFPLIRRWWKLNRGL